MSEFNDQNQVITYPEGFTIWIKEVPSGSMDSSRAALSSNGTMTLKRNYILRKYQTAQYNAAGVATRVQLPIEPMHQSLAYGALQEYILKNQYVIDYISPEFGTVRMWASKIRVDVDKSNFPAFKGECTWEYDPRKPNYLLQPVTWSHRMVGGTRNMAYPVVPQQSYAPPDVPVIPYAGVNYDAAKGSFEGVDCYSPEWRMTAKQQQFAYLVTPQYLMNLMSVSKTVNDALFRGFHAGTVLYLGADVDEAPHVIGKMQTVDITHHFVVEPNMLPFWYGNIWVNGGKYGHDYMWVSSYRTAKGVQIDQVNIAAMYMPGDFRKIKLPFEVYAEG